MSGSPKRLWPDPAAPESPAAPPPPAGAAPAPAPQAEAAPDLLFELDVPVRASADAGAPYSLSAPAGTEVSLRPEPVPEPVSPESSGAGFPRAEAGEPAASTSDPLPQGFHALQPPQEHDPATLRLQRLVVRIQTVRDAFRLLSALGFDQESRNAIARSLKELEGLAERRTGDPSLIKEPERALRQTPAGLFDALESKLSAVEDQLLQLDELVPRELFRERVEQGEFPRKHLARYARLLASRRFQAGPRRDRFEWLATRLLTARGRGGELDLLPPPRARTVLQHLVGGLVYKARDDELSEAVAFLREAHEKLDRFLDADEFFESGFFLDTHGFKVSMRDQLAHPDFLYLSVAVNVKLHNLLERWIAELERLHETRQLPQEVAPRELLTARLREQETAVDRTFGVRTRVRLSVPSKPSLAEIKSQRAEAKRYTKETKRKRPRRELGSSFDGELLKLTLLAALVLGSAGYVLTTTGAMGRPEAEALSSQRLATISPLLVRGWIRGSGSDRELDAVVDRSAWRELKPRERSVAADNVAKQLASHGIQAAVLKAGNTVALEIRNGLVIRVAGDL